MWVPQIFAGTSVKIISRYLWWGPLPSFLSHNLRSPLGKANKPRRHAKYKINKTKWMSYKFFIRFEIFSNCFFMLSSWNTEMLKFVNNSFLLLLHSVIFCFVVYNLFWGLRMIASVDIINYFVHVLWNKKKTVQWFIYSGYFCCCFRLRWIFQFIGCC